jgi:hypothetical protein
MRSWMLTCSLVATSVLMASACLNAPDGGGASQGNGGSTESKGGAGSGGSSSTAQGGSGGTASATGGSGTGGSSSSGGTTGSGGATSSGGSTAGGGSTNSGGATARGGNTGRGGTTSGGTTAQGGATSSGGATGSGDSTARGGTTASGGSTARGGTTATGGSTARGGTTATGGSTAEGGTTGSGGATGSGGSTSTSTLAKFSFFVISYKAITALSGSTDGFGGDLRYGETGAGAGLRGADKICAAVAERSMAGSSAKQWRAFLSVTADESGKQVNAIDRVGSGPWYDRLGRTFALTKADLINERPANIDAAIQYDLPNEDGVPNHNPDKTSQVDNHDTVTGSNAQGQLSSATATCKDWTVADAASTNGKPRVGHTWPTGGERSCGGGSVGGGMGGGDGGMCHWISALDEAGCAAGVNLKETGGPGNDGKIGSGGGYGGFYCFALTP